METENKLVKLPPGYWAKLDEIASAIVPDAVKPKNVSAAYQWQISALLRAIVEGDAVVEWRRNDD